MGALQFNDPQEIKTKMKEYVNKYFNDSIQDIHIFAQGHVHEPYTVQIENKTTKKPIVWIKFLTEKIKDEVWKQHQESRAGKESVVM